MAIERRNDMMTEVVLLISTDDAFILSSFQIKIIILEVVQCFNPSSIWLKFQLNSERILTNYSSEVTRHIPVCFLLVTVTK